MDQRIEPPEPVEDPSEPVVDQLGADLFSQICSNFSGVPLTPAKMILEATQSAQMYRNGANSVVDVMVGAFFNGQLSLNFGIKTEVDVLATKIRARLQAPQDPNSPSQVQIRIANSELNN